MASSDQKINYSMRPSKAIERRMLLEVIKEVCIPANVDQYEYIGFGAAFFADFKLFHRTLGIKNMTSIEGSKKGVERCKFNRPFRTIKIIEGRSNEVLPTFQWKRKSIIWLDYDKGLQNYMFDDTATCLSKVKPGSFFILSMRRDFDVDTVEALSAKIGDHCDSSLKNEDLQPTNAAKTLHKLLNSKFQDIVVNRSSALPPNEKLVFVQLFNYTYSDNAYMYTLGGILIKESELAAFRSLKLNTYHFVNRNPDAINISTPIVTQKEFVGLNALLPLNNRASFVTKARKYDFLDKNILEAFYNTYRYYLPYIEVSEM